MSFHNALTPNGHDYDIARAVEAILVEEDIEILTYGAMTEEDKLVCAITTHLHWIFVSPSRISVTFKSWIEGASFELADPEVFTKLVAYLKKDLECYTHRWKNAGG